ncbi:HAMP domain-containing sensor histidine kinase [uncultured Bartonella sp.]|uniref:sensor histidine kinase n=1 Tax=uncultured Bartonella sp. TaxID=104108 RepID=UPI0026310AF9|nr:HAMP domain-containing sensor histidine kinase [uncultured Bartonella sp.]
MTNEDIIDKAFPTSLGASLHDRQEKIPFYRRMRIRLLLLITLSVFITEIMVFIPSIASMQSSWLEDHHQSAKAIGMILASTPDPALSRNLEKNVLLATDALAITIIEGAQKYHFAVSKNIDKVNEVINLPDYSETKALLDSLATLYFGGNNILLVRGPIDGTNIDLQVTLSDKKLREAMVQFSWHFVVISLTIAIVAATTIYFIVHELLVRPLQNIYTNMLDFVMEPHNPSRILVPESRYDEVGITQKRISVIESELQKSYARQKHLANLGLAVSKINHDMRNILASAQLVSDHLADAKDPMVKKIAPKLIKAIDRAVTYSQTVITYGRTQEPTPKRQRLLVHKLVDDVFESLTLPGTGTVDFVNNVPVDVTVDADEEQLHRVITNLCRNAVQAMVEREDGTNKINKLIVSGRRCGQSTIIDVADTGPGLPAKAKEHLFSPFQGSTSKNGTGLGLTICEELIHAHGGTLKLVDSEEELSDGQKGGAHFEIRIPDTPNLTKEQGKSNDTNNN